MRLSTLAALRCDREKVQKTLPRAKIFFSDMDMKNPEF
jgi:hypothetical protein